MGYHSQNNEAQVVAEYFGDFKGTLLDVGANDGITFSNSYDLIAKGWGAHLFEPSLISYTKLKYLHDGNENVFINHAGIGESIQSSRFYESDAHVKGGHDYGLVSSLDYKETVKWRNQGVRFYDTTINLVPFSTICHHLFQFISIDTEGHDWTVLQQINLQDVDCRCLCIEWNGDPFLFGLYAEYVERFGMKELHRNRENLIFVI